MRTLLRVLVLGGCLAGPCALVAQPPPPAPKETTKPQEPPVREKDPTIPSERLKEVLNSSKDHQLNASLNLPTIVLKGRVVIKTRQPLALLEVEGKSVTVTKGETILAGQNLILKLLEVNGNEVRVEVQPLADLRKRVIVLH